MFLFRKPFVISFFLLMGLAAEFLFWQGKQSVAILIMMAPVISIVHLLESVLPFLMSLSPLQNELFTIFPLTLIYFGFIGYWLCQIGREDGFLKYMIFIAFTGFLIVIHWQAFEYIENLMFRTT